MSAVLLVALFSLQLAQSTPAPAPPSPPPSSSDPAAPPQVPPPAASSVDELSDEDEGPSVPMHATGVDPFSNEAGATKTSLRTLTQVRYTNTWVKRSSLTQTGDISELTGLPASADEAAALGAVENATAQNGDGYSLYRAFLRVEAVPTEKVEAKLLIDFAEFLRKNPKRSLKQAYADMSPMKRVHILAGVFKRTFSLLELLPIADYELAEVGPTDDFLKDLGFAGRDAGVAIQVRPLQKKKRLTLWVGAFDGDVEQGWNGSPVKLLTARIESEFKKVLRLGLDGAWRPFDNKEYYEKSLFSGPAQTVLGKGWATSADLTLRLGGFETRAEGILGTRTDVDDPFFPLQVRRGPARKFQAWWLLSVYHAKIGHYVINPAIRVEWLDGDRDHSNGGLLYTSAGVAVDFTKHVRVLVDLSNQQSQDHSRGYQDVPYLSNKVNVYPFLVDFTSLTVQMQLLL